MATSEAEEQQSTSSSSSSSSSTARNFERANKALTQLDLARENLTHVESSRALIFLLGWPDAEREVVLAAARDNNFGLGQFEIPNEVIRAAREDTLGSATSSLVVESSNSRTIHRDSCIPAAYYVSFTSTTDAIAELTSARGMLLRSQVRRRSPQICKKCLQPRKGHICQPIPALQPEVRRPALLDHLPSSDIYCYPATPQEPEGDSRTKAQTHHGASISDEMAWHESFAGQASGGRPGLSSSVSSSAQLKREVSSEDIAASGHDRRPSTPPPRSDQETGLVKKARLG